MSELRRRRCIFGCDALVTYGVPIHRFPNPDKHHDLFAAWVAAVGSNVTETDRTKIYKNKRICDHHFDPTFKTTGGRLICSAIPTVNLNRVQQTVSTFAETDHSYCQPTRKFVHMVDITNLPGSSYQTKPLPDSSRSGLSTAVDCTEFPGPSGSTCLTSREKSHARTPMSNFDAGKTSEYLQKKAETLCARKTRQLQNEVSRLRQNLKTHKLRIKQLEHKIANRDFEKLSRNMSEPAKLFIRMQCREGRKKKKGHRFTHDEKVLSLSIFKKSPKAYKLLCKHFTLPSKKVLKSLVSQVKLTPGINEIVLDR